MCEPLQKTLQVLVASLLLHLDYLSEPVKRDNTQAPKQRSQNIMFHEFLISAPFWWAHHFCIRSRVTRRLADPQLDQLPQGIHKRRQDYIKLL